MSRFPYSSVAPMVADGEAARSDGEATLPKAMVAATVTTPARAQIATTIPMPRNEESGFMIGRASL
jgi:hypothetical protein